MSFHQQLNNKIIDRETASAIVKRLREQSHKVVFTNGCFDIVHPGHVDYLARARDLGDFLVVGLNTDSSVKRLQKAPGRPVNDENSRAMVLAALASVDAIVLFDEDTPYELISLLQPDVLVKGSDYKKHEVVGHDIVEARGGEVVTIPLLEGFSTSAIIRKITS
jgi:D-glycero-beta-D-manno-heptose 1-phosphate adenylyltransferase